MHIFAVSLLGNFKLLQLLTKVSQLAKLRSKQLVLVVLTYSEKGAPAGNGLNLKL
jgi:hypothetical protein